jgi:large subunit ribosomal protein L31
MKPGIHPNYVEAVVTCSCGNTFTTRSTKPTLRTDLCSVCHPFYTGEQRIVDTAGQVERFTRRMQNAQATAGQKSKRQRRLAARGEQDTMTDVEDSEVEGNIIQHAGVEFHPGVLLFEACFKTGSTLSAQFSVSRPSPAPRRPRPGFP